MVFDMEYGMDEVGGCLHSLKRDRKKGWVQLNRVLREREIKVLPGNGSFKSVPNVQIQNHFNKLKMSYIQEFLSIHLPKYYQSTLDARLQHPNFFNSTLPNSIFDLTHQIFTLNSIHSSVPLRSWFGQLISREFQIGYDCLRNFSLPTNPNDSVIVKTMKSSLSYVHTMMVQLMFRFIKIFLECEESQFIKNTTLKMIQDVRNIYPILKTEISINHEDINLTQFIEKYINLISSHSNSEATIQALAKIKIACNFTGSTQRFIANLIEQKKKNTDLITKQLDFSSIDSEEESNRQTKESKEKHFNEAEFFRKRKPKMIVKDIKSSTLMTALKSTKSMSTIEATPLKTKYDFPKKTPKSQKRDPTLKDQNEQPKKKTPLLKKIKKQMKKPLDRTIYHAEIKKFIPKKGLISDDIFSIKESLTSSVNFEHFAFVQSNKKTLKKTVQTQEEIEEGISMFCVPETPRQHMHKKIVGRRLI